MKKIASAALVLLTPFLMAATKPQPAPPAKAAPAPAAKAAPAKPAPVKAPVKPQASQQPKSVAAKKSVPAPDDFNSAKAYPLQVLNFPGGVTMTEMVYSTPAGFRPLTLDLYLPPGKGFPVPALIFVHGGSWDHGDSRHGGTFGDFPALLASLAARGMVVASIDYRLSGEAKFPAALQDVKSAIRWIRANAGEYNVDDTRIALWGASAGGHLAALAGVTCGVANLEPPTDPKVSKPPSDCVQAVIDWYGVTDLETLYSDFGKPAPDKSAAGDFLGCEPALCPIGVTRNASPLTYIESMAPPFLIMHGAADTTVSPKQSQTLYDALRAKNVPAELVTYSGVAHDFAPAANTSPGAFDAAVNKQAVEKLEAFLDATFPKKPMTAPYKPVKPKPLPY